MTAAQGDEPRGAPPLPRGHGPGLSAASTVLHRLWTNLCEVTGLGFGHIARIGGRQRKNVDSTKPAISSTRPMSRKLLLRLAAGEQLQVVADDHDARRARRQVNIVTGTHSWLGFAFFGVGGVYAARPGAAEPWPCVFERAIDGDASERIPCGRRAGARGR